MRKHKREKERNEGRGMEGKKEEVKEGWREGKGKRRGEKMLLKYTFLSSDVLST